MLVPTRQRRGANLSFSEPGTAFMTNTHLSRKILVLRGTVLMLTTFHTGTASYASILSSIAVRQYALCGLSLYCLYVCGTS